MDIVLDQLISILFEYWIPAAVIIGLPTKWRSFCDHRFCDVTSLYVYAQSLVLGKSLFAKRLLRLSAFCSVQLIDCARYQFSFFEHFKHVQPGITSYTASGLYVYCIIRVTKIIQYKSVLNLLRRL